MVFPWVQGEEEAGYGEQDEFVHHAKLFGNSVAHLVVVELPLMPVHTLAQEAFVVPLLVWQTLMNKATRSQMALNQLLALLIP